MPALFVVIINHRLFPLISACILLVMVFFSLLSAFFTWRSDWQLAHAPVYVLQVDNVLENNTRLMNALPDTHLFGESLASMGNAPLTSLQLHLMGISKIMNESNGASSKALIAMGNKPGKLYQVGDNLSYDVKIVAITDSVVILQSDGHLEKLPLARSALIFKPRGVMELG